MIENLEELARDDCARRSFGLAFFDEHLAIVAHYANRLAECLGANAEVVGLASWLHDLAAVRDPKAQPEHPRLGAELAPQLLAPYRYDLTIVDQVSRAIASHSFPLQPGAATPEEVCLSQADAIAQIVRPFYWLYFVTSVRGLGYEEAKKWLVNLLASKWEALVPASRELVGERCTSALELLG